MNIYIYINIQTYSHGYFPRNRKVFMLMPYQGLGVGVLRGAGIPLLENRKVRRIYQIYIPWFLIDMKLIAMNFEIIFNTCSSFSNAHLHTIRYKWCTRNIKKNGTGAFIFPKKNRGFIKNNSFWPCAHIYCIVLEKMVSKLAIIISIIFL